MIMTVVEARVSPERRDALSERFELAVAQASGVLIQTMLLRCARDIDSWCIAAIQADDGVLEDEMYEPGSVDIFRSIGSEPTTVSCFRIVSVVEQPAAVVSIRA